MIERIITVDLIFTGKTDSNGDDYFDLSGVRRVGSELSYEQALDIQQRIEDDDDNFYSNGAWAILQSLTGGYYEVSN